jgi:hypothetical protein
MSTIKIALIGFGIVVALSTAAEAYDQRFGNGTSSVTITPSTDTSVESQSPAFGSAKSDYALSTTSPSKSRRAKRTAR